jgi:hypothetical protein
VKPEKPKYEKKLPEKPSETSSEPKPSFEKPKLYVEPDPTPCQNVRILDCDKPVSRVFYECYHCRQGLLSECESQAPVEEFEVRCTNCGKTAMRLVASKVLSTTAIPSPWG